MTPRDIAHIYETCLYCRDLWAARSFYEGVLGLRMVDDFAPTALTFRISPLSVLIVFDPDESMQGGRSVPSRPGRGMWRSGSGRTIWLRGAST